MGTIGFVQLCFETKCGRFLTIRKMPDLVDISKYLEINKMRVISFNTFVLYIGTEIYGDQPDVGHVYQTWLTSKKMTHIWLIFR